MTQKGTALLVAAAAAAWWAWDRWLQSKKSPATVNATTNVTSADTAKSVKELIANLAKTNPNASKLEFLGDGLDVTFQSFPDTNLAIWNGGPNKLGYVNGEPMAYVDGDKGGFFLSGGGLIPWDLVPPKPGTSVYPIYLDLLGRGMIHPGVLPDWYLERDPSPTP